MCTLVSRDPFVNMWNVKCILETKLHMTNLARSKVSCFSMFIIRKNEKIFLRVHWIVFGGCMSAKKLANFLFLCKDFWHIAPVPYFSEYSSLIATFYNYFKSRVWYLYSVVQVIIHWGSLNGIEYQVVL